MQYTCDCCFEKFIDETNLQFHKEIGLCGIGLRRDPSHEPTTSAINNEFSSPISHSNFDANYESLQQRAFHTEKTPLEGYISKECFKTEENLIQHTGIHQSSDMFSCSRNLEIKNVPEFHSNIVLNNEHRQSFDKFVQSSYYEKNHLIHSDESSISLSIESNMNYPSCSSNTSVENSRNFDQLEKQIWNSPNDISFGTVYTNTPTSTDKETFTFPAHQNDPNVAVSVLQGSNKDYFTGEVDKVVENSTSLGNLERQNRNFSNNSISPNMELTNAHLVAEKEALISPVCPRSAVKRRERIHTGERAYSCRICTKRFRTQQLLVEHERFYTAEHFSCRICLRTFITKSALVSHELNCTEERLLLCKFCPYRCINKKDLVRHERIHTGERPYACKICSRTFTRQSNLKQHERVHTGERPYACKFCSRTFTQQCNLKQHERKHTDK